MKKLLVKILMKKYWLEFFVKIKKNIFCQKKKILIAFLIFLIFIVWTLFFWWLSNKYNKKINLENNSNEQKEESEKNEIVEKLINPKEKQVGENNKEISFENLGNFWLEINTANLKIKAPIVEGVTPERLDQGIGHHKTTAFPNREKGNVVLSGHRWMPNAEKNPSRIVFLNLDKLKIGDEIKLYFKNEEFVYKIIETKIISEDDISILNQTEKPQVTLYTCTPAYVETTKRLVYIGELVK